MKVRRNYPYTGKSDGFTAYLRRHFPADAYISIKLEINQKHVYRGGRLWRAMRSQLIETLRMAITAVFIEPMKAIAPSGQRTTFP